MLRRCLLASCMLLIGLGPATCLQLTAWAGMLVSRTASTGFDQAVSTTFDGAHPCPLCCAVVELRGGDELHATTTVQELRQALVERSLPPESDWAPVIDTSSGSSLLPAPLADWPDGPASAPPEPVPRSGTGLRAARS